MSDLAKTIDDMIPRSLDDVIRTNRNLAELRLASDQELSAIVGKINAATPKDEISNYRFVSLVLKNPDVVSVHLLGTCSSGSSWVTSQVTVLEPERGYALTRSGSLYKLLGSPAHDEPDRDDLICLCAILNQWGIGPRLGVPAFFY